MRALTLVLVVASIGITLAQGRGGGPPLAIPRAGFGDGPWTVEAAEGVKIRMSVVTKGLANPWSLAWLPDGGILITERPGRLRLVKNGVLDPTPISGVPAVKAQRLSGLMDVVLHPRFAENRFVYLTYNKGRDDGMMATVLARGRLEGMALKDVKDLFVAEPWWDGAGGSASRIVFGRDGMLYMTAGSGGGANAGQGQVTNIHKGKIMRLRDDGTVPPDNPFVGRPGTKPEIWSYGHRNAQGLALHPATGKLWQHEHGPRGGDEVNVIDKGKNYGWPAIGYGIDYSGARIHASTQREGMEQPGWYWVPSIAPSGMAFYSGSLFPAWRGHLFVGALASKVLVRLELAGEKVMKEERLDMRERIRDVRQGPDEALWLTTDASAGRIVRVAPAR
jgi:aldose sugar dehydrogenase